VAEADHDFVFRRDDLEQRYLAGGERGMIERALENETCEPDSEQQAV